MKSKDQKRLSEVTAGLKKKAAPAGQMELKETDHKEEAALTKGDVLPEKVDYKPAPKSSGRFDYVKYDEIAQAKSAAIKAKCIELEILIEETFGAVPPSPLIARYKALAITALEDVFTNSGKALREEQRIVRKKAELQEERNNA